MGDQGSPHIATRLGQAISDDLTAEIRSMKRSPSECRCYNATSGWERTNPFNSLSLGFETAHRRFPAPSRQRG